jgi:hypothetical protein
MVSGIGFPKHRNQARQLSHKPGAPTIPLRATLVTRHLSTLRHAIRKVAPDKHNLNRPDLPFGQQISGTLPRTVRKDRTPLL